jgi:hypothetical protein
MTVETQLCDENYNILATIIYDSTVLCTELFFKQMSEFIIRKMNVKETGWSGCFRFTPLQSRRATL